MLFLTEEAASSAERFREIRAVEFSQLDTTGHTYLDYTGSALPPRSLIDRHAELLGRELMGNPHSDSQVSNRSTEFIESARARVLSFFDADPEEYTVCFTANASSAIHRVAEAFPFDSTSKALLTADNHNSVNGVRCYAARAGARVLYVPLRPDLRLDEAVICRAFEGQRSGPSLFAYPAQSNFSGVKHPLWLIREAQSRGYRTLLDAAAFVPSTRLSLREHHPDYVCVSFYKMFGYPTGVGALIARQKALDLLRRPWFTGGTVDFVSVQHDLVQPLRGPERFEDGTPNFQAIAAVPAGLDFLDAVGVHAVRDHVTDLTSKLLTQLKSLRHANGAPLVRLYGPETPEGRGGTIAMNLIDPEGYGVPYQIVERQAADAEISIRGGCFCNPGASEHAFAIPGERSKSCLKTLMTSGFTPQRFSECAGDVIVGAVRVSVGLANHPRDTDRLVKFLSTFLDRASPRPLNSLVS